MTATTPNPYLRTKIMTAAPAELRLMLIDGAIKFLEHAIQGLDDANPEGAYNGFTRCQNIVMELINSLRPDQAPELCQRLSGLYTFMYTRLVTACVDRDIEVAREVLDLLRYERETWTMLMDQLATEATGAVTERAGPINVSG